MMRQDAKIVYYLSMEFLMGRALGKYDYQSYQAEMKSRRLLKNLGLDLNVIEDQEPDAALGNGGLGTTWQHVSLISLSTLELSGLWMWYQIQIRYVPAED